jgi:hypothetical protein
MTKNNKEEKKNATSKKGMMTPVAELKDDD